jgi:hypothetical protein
MSVGDIIRLNRMYKCGAPYINTLPQTLKSTTERIVPQNKVINSSSSNRTIFGVLIFKAVESN